MKWVDTYSDALNNMMKADIDIAGTVYGRMLALKEKELNTAVSKMIKEKRDELRRKLDGKLWVCSN